MDTALANICSMLKPDAFKITKAMKLAPDNSSTALIICTQVVANIPPNNTYATIKTPTMTTADR